MTRRHWIANTLVALVLGVLFAWLCTAVFQAPIHLRLMRGFDAPLIRRLILSNWIRTLAWTARGILVSLSLL